MTLNAYTTELHRHGNRLLAARSYDDALSVFRKLIDEAPSDPEGYIGAAKALQVLGRDEDVLRLLSPVAEGLGSGQLLFLVGDSCRVLANRGRAGMVDSALHYFALLHKIRHNPLSLHYEGQMFQKKRDYDSAYRSFAEAWRLEPRDRRSYTAALFCLRKLGRTDEANALKVRWASATG